MKKLERLIKKCFIVKPAYCVIAIAVILVATIAISIIGSLYDSTDSYWWRTIFASLFIGTISTFIAIVIGFSSLEDSIKNYHRRLQLQHIATLWPNIANEGIGFTVYYTGLLGSFRDRAKWAQHASLATVYSLLDIKKFFSFWYDEPSVLHYQLTDNPSQKVIEKTNHLIIIGGPLNLPFLRQLYSRLTLQFSHSENILPRAVNAANKPFLCTKIETHNDNIVTDYGLITIIAEPNTGRRLYWFSGNYGFGTYGAILAAIGKGERYEKFKTPNPGTWSQYVVEVDSIKNEMMDEDHYDISIVRSIYGDTPREFKINEIWPNNVGPE